MVLTLRLLLAALGLVAVCICLSILLYGPADTANSFEALFNALTGLKLSGHRRVAAYDG